MHGHHVHRKSDPGILYCVHARTGLGQGCLSWCNHVHVKKMLQNYSSWTSEFPKALAKVLVSLGRPSERALLGTSKGTREWEKEGLQKTGFRFTMECVLHNDDFEFELIHVIHARHHNIVLVQNHMTSAMWLDLPTFRQSQRNPVQSLQTLFLSLPLVPFSSSPCISLVPSKARSEGLPRETTKGGGGGVAPDPIECCASHTSIKPHQCIHPSYTTARTHEYIAVKPLVPA